MSQRFLQILFAAGCAAVILFELRAVFVDRFDTFAIEGTELEEIAEFASGRPVSHAFLMRGDGLYAIRVLLNSDSATEARLRWKLWRGSADIPPMTPAGGDEAQLVLKPGRQWATFDVIRDGSSNNRWYTIELQLLHPIAAEATDGAPSTPRVSVVASHDNPDRGGVLWVEAARRPGALVLHAERRGRTLYGRFQAEAAPHLPAVLRMEAAQWLVAVVFHWALIVFAYGVINDAIRTSRSRS